MRKLYTITNLTDVRVSVGYSDNVWIFALDKDDRLDIVSDVIPVVEGERRGQVMFTERLAEGWEHGYRIT